MVTGNATMAGLSFRLDFESTRPIYLQIIDEVKRAVARGHLQPGDKLPSQRELAELARVNPNTVQRAFREMEVTGLVETLRGQGTFLRNDPGLIQEVRLEMAQMAVVQFVHEMQRLGLDVAEAIGLVRHMWGEQGQLQERAEGSAQSVQPGHAQDRAQAQALAQTEGENHASGRTDADTSGTCPAEQDR